jgi:3-oxoacyl-[acyl-carrier protein] reductase
MLENQLAMVTGASRGIGRAIALELGRRGAKVIGTATSAAGARGIDEYLAAAGIAGRGMTLDVSTAASVDACFKELEASDGTPAILVNNAGVTRDGLLIRMSAEDWQTVIETDLSAVFRTCKAVMRGMMKARHGRIVNIASVIGVMGNAGQSNYAAAKAGMIGFSKSLAREVGSRGITVNVVAPGFIVTDMTDALGEPQKQALLAQVPLGRLGAAEDVAHAVAFLASPGASYITGETLHVNGGMYMICIRNPAYWTPPHRKH